MDFYLTTDTNNFPCFQITWTMSATSVYSLLYFVNSLFTLVVCNLFISLPCCCWHKLRQDYQLLLVWGRNERLEHTCHVCNISHHITPLHRGRIYYSSYTHHVESHENIASLYLDIVNLYNLGNLCQWAYVVSLCLLLVLVKVWSRCTAHVRHVQSKQETRWLDRLYSCSV